jgi:hypothetical protein
LGGLAKVNPDIKSFGPKSQIEGNVYWVQKIYADATADRSYAADLEAKMLDRRGMKALRQQRLGGINAGFWGRYTKALPEMLSASRPLPAAPSASPIALAISVYNTVRPIWRMSSQKNYLPKPTACLFC